MTINHQRIVVSPTTFHNPTIYWARRIAVESVGRRPTHGQPIRTGWFWDCCLYHETSDREFIRSARFNSSPGVQVVDLNALLDDNFYNETKKNLRGKREIKWDRDFETFEIGEKLDSEIRNKHDVDRLTSPFPHSKVSQRA